MSYLREAFEVDRKVAEKIHTFYGGMILPELLTMARVLGTELCVWHLVDTQQKLL